LADTKEKAPVEARLPRKAMLFFMKAAVGAALVVFMVYSGHLDLRSPSRAWAEGQTWLAAAFLAMLCIPLLGGVRWWMMLRAQGMNAGLAAALRLTYIGAFFNTFLPGATGGDVVRMYGAAAGFPERRAAAALTVIADRAAGFFGLFLLALFVLAFNYDAIMREPLIREAAIILAVVMAAALSAIFLVASERLRQRRHSKYYSKPGRIRDALKKMDDAAGMYRGKRGTLAAAVGISLVGHVGSIIALYAAARSLGEAAIPLRRYLFLAPLVFAVNSIPLSPGGVGQGESFAEAIFRTQGGGGLLGAETFFIYRLVAMAAWLIGLVFYLTGKVGFREMARTGEAVEEEIAHLPSDGDGPPEDSASQG